MGKSIRNLYVDDAAFDEDEENDAASGEAAEDGAEAEEAEEAKGAGGGADAGEAPEAGADGEGGSVAEDAVCAIIPHSQLAVLACAQDVKGLETETVSFCLSAALSVSTSVLLYAPG